MKRMCHAAAAALALLACDTETPSTAPAAPTSIPPSPPAPVPSAAEPSAPATATTSAALAPWPPPGVQQRPSKLAGFDVFIRGGITVSLKRYYVDNVDNRKTAAFPGCVGISVLRGRKSVEVVAEGGDRLCEPGRPCPTWIVFRDKERYGVYVESEHTPQGDYGTDVACCHSGDEHAAHAARATLGRSQADEALRMCRDAMIRNAR